MSSRHVIESLEFAVDFAGEEQAFDAQTRLSDFLHRAAGSVIGPVFDEFSEAGERLSLEHLEIDLGEVALTDMESLWQDRLRERLRESLREALQRAAHDDSPSAVISTSRAQAQLEAFTAFLLDGHLSWRVPDGNATRLAAAAVNENGPALAAWLLAALGTNSGANRQPVIARLVSHLADRELMQLLAGLIPQLSSGYRNELQSFLVTALQTGGGGYAQRRRLIWEALLNGLLTANKAATAEARLQEALGRVFDQDGLADSLPVTAGLPLPARQRSLSLRRQADAAKRTALSPVHSVSYRARLRSQLFIALAQEERGRAAELWQELLRAAPGYLREQLVRKGQAAKVRRQIALQFSEPMLLDLVGLFVPTERHFIELAIAHTEEMARQEAERAPQGLKAHLWEFTLAHLLVDRGSAFNRRSYMGGLLQAVAVREGLEYRDLLQSMVAALQVSGVTTGLQKQLLQLLAELQEIQQQSRELLAGRNDAPAAKSQPVEEDPYLEPGFSRRQFAAHLADGDLRAITPLWRRVRTQDTEWTRLEIHRQGQSSLLRHRLADSLPEPILCELAELLVPREGEFIAAAIHTVAPLTARGAQEQAEDREIGAVRRELWEFTLSYLLADRGSAFNKRSYMAGVLQQMAARETMEYGQLLAAVRSALEKVAHPGALHKQMLALIAELAPASSRNAFSGPAPDTVTGVTDAETNTRTLRAELALALSDASGGIWQRLWTQWQARAPALLKEEILRTGRTPWQRQRLVETLSATLRPALISLLLPQEGEFIAGAIKDGATAMARLPQADDPARQTGRLWEFSLTFALSDQGGSFNRRSYAAYLLQKLAARDGMQYRELLRKLTEVLHALPATQLARGGLLQVLLELEQVEDAASAHARGKTAAARTGQTGDAAADAERLRELLATNEPMTVPQSSELRTLAEAMTLRATAKDRRLLETLLQERTAVQRLVATVAPSVLAAMLYRLRPADHYLAQKCAEHLIQICRLQLADAGSSVDAATSSRLVALQWQFLLRYFFEEERIFSVADFARRFADYLAAQLQTSNASAWADGLLQRAAATNEGAPGELMAGIAAALSGSARISGDGADTGTGEGADHGAAGAAKRAKAAENSTGDASARHNAPKEHEPIYIGNAGLVILAPYFPRLFEMLGYTANQVFVSEPARQRAMLACQYAATGNDHVEESELPLNKLLCGAPIAEVVAIEPPLSHDEKAAVDGLLHSVIAHWTALGKSSVDGLRGAFLFREGRLLPRSDDWELLVEPRSYDMLLDRLPWGFATIKYSWMPGMIHVSWR